MFGFHGTARRVRYRKTVIKIPYIEKEKRVKFDGLIKQLANNIRSLGEVNYVITKLLHTVIGNDENFCYALLNGIIGVLDCAKMELYRMVVAKYEDKKRRKNGGVSEFDAKTFEDVR